MNKRLKKSVSAALICAMMLTTSTAALGITSYADSTKVSATQSKSYKVTSRKVTTYLGGTKGDAKTKSKLYFMNGTDVPYMKIEDFFTYAKMLIAEDNANYEVAIEKKDDKVLLVRENGCYALINFADDTVYFIDYNGFTGGMTDGLMDVSAGMPKDSSGNPLYLKELASSSALYGDDKTMDLGSYGIDLVRKGDSYYMPVQTLTDIFLTAFGANIVFNGESLIFLGGSSKILDDYGNVTDLGKIYYKVTPGKISKALAKYSYNELCFAFDNLYGLKEIHGIKSFKNLVQQRGLEKDFTSTNPKKIDNALYSIIHDNLDDLHSAYVGSSYASGSDYSKKLSEKYGISRSTESLVSKMYEIAVARAKYYPDGVPVYEEIGDTAFITFDNFTMFAQDYYEKAPTAETKDTIGIMAYSTQQILREGSPIKNVVLDLSNNTGGAVPSALYTLGAILGKGSISIEDPNTNALVTHDYNVDTNFDGKYDASDTLAQKGLNFYCMTSRVSFSCGNLVPNALKNSCEVTIIGQTSGGGSCCVLPMTTATGTIFNLSGSLRMSFLKNGSFYDIDLGATPDVYLSKAESFADREKLVELIDGLL